jgi:hypothetical protein
MDVIGHNYPCVQLVVAEFDALVKAINYNCCDIRAREVHGPSVVVVQLAVRRDEAAARQRARRRGRRDAAVETPCYEEGCAFGMDVRLTAMRHTS